MSLPPIAILAGGLATRMNPITATIPKALIDIAGEPFIAHQLRLLRQAGATDVVLCVGHLGDQIRDFVGDGAKFGINVRYSFDGPVLRGTGGAIEQASALLGNVFMVLYGDSYLDIAYAPVAEAFRKAGKPALLTVFHNQGRFDSSNVVFSGGMVQVYDKAARSEDMQYIDYGLSVLSIEVFEPFRGQAKLDLSEVYSYLARERRLAGFEVDKRFYEIGSPEGLRQTSDYIANRFPNV